MIVLTRSITSSLTDSSPDQMVSATRTNPTRRLLSLDALRGFDMFWIVSGEGLFHSLANVVKDKYSLLRDPDDWTIATTGQLSAIERLTVKISNQLHHTPWNGLSFYDIIFPLFIFISGVSMPFAFANYFQAENASDKKTARKKLYISLIKRTIILIVLGMVVNGALQMQSYESTRFASVLGRIGMACFFAALIYIHCSLRFQILSFLIILTGYWAMMALVPVPSYGAGVLTPDGNLSAFIDRSFLPGKLHRTVYDPEGLFSTIPAVATALLGIFTGQFLKTSIRGLNQIVKTAVLIASGISLIALGQLWNIAFPINKILWTSSFVLSAGGWSILLLAAFYWIIDVCGYVKWSMPFIWIGANSILIYMAAHGLFNFESTSQFLFGGLINHVSGAWQQVILWTGVLLIQLKLLYFLYSKKIFLKI